MRPVVLSTRPEGDEDPQLEELAAGQALAGVVDADETWAWTWAWVVNASGLRNAFGFLL